MRSAVPIGSDRIEHRSAGDRPSQERRTPAGGRGATSGPVWSQHPLHMRLRRALGRATCGRGAAGIAATWGNGKCPPLPAGLLLCLKTSRLAREAAYVTSIRLHNARRQLMMSLCEIIDALLRKKSREKGVRFPPLLCSFLSSPYLFPKPSGWSRPKGGTWGVNTTGHLTVVCLLNI